MSRILIWSLFLCGLLASCTEKKTATTESKEVNLAIWGNYLSEEMQSQFEKETGIKIHISNYSSNEELLAKAQMGSSGIDVAVPSDYMVDIMTKMNLLEPLQTTLIPNKDGIAERFLRQDFDPENKYSLPYTWTTVGIAINRDLYKGPLKSWKDLFNHEELKGKIALLDDVRETMGAALLLHGFSVNSIQPEEVKKAKETLLAAKKNIKMFSSDTVDILSNKEVIAAQAYSSDAQQAATKTSGKIEFITPSEGATIAIDNLVILKGAQNSRAAHKLINFLLSKAADKSKVTVIKSGPILKEHLSLLPSADALKKLVRIRDLGKDNRLYEEAWLEIKTK
ncbi:ABC transporter substrate-binding protein [Bdellovibrio sp.]|uniref:ABC transporter substrate-binding protein n=1 Tax=Bdellovibrio sp. TaxID=28201 RepID=UPI0039E4565C